MFLCGLAKTLHILNQQENYYVHVACNRLLVKGSGMQS